MLRDLIRFSHAERSIRPELTEETLDAVDGWARAYHGLVRARRSGLAGLDLDDER